MKAAILKTETLEEKPHGSFSGMTSQSGMDIRHDGTQTVLSLSGRWGVRQAADMRVQLGRLVEGQPAPNVIDLGDVQSLDTAAVLILTRFRENFCPGAEMVNVPPHLTDMIALVEKAVEARKSATVPARRRRMPLDIVEAFGKASVSGGAKIVEVVSFLGLVVSRIGLSVVQPSRFRPLALINQIERAGFSALPIVGLLSFLIGVVLAYLMSDQLRRFGGDVFTVNLIGLSVLREIGVLMTAIIVAGRSGSAFTAEIGTMKVNEEIDAMQTIGLDPVEVLVIPRVLGLLIALPLLTFFSDIMGILGGMTMSAIVLDLSPVQFLSQLKDAVDLDDLFVGIVKSPVHAVIIALIGCYEGLKVKRSAESVGRMTTLSVVESIFLVIIATAIFAIIFSILGI